jgi:hypothetical protein
MPTVNCVEAVQRSVNTAEAHIRSEYVRDLAGTMATVSAGPNYAVTAEPGVVSVISGRDGVSAFYEAAHKFAVPQASRFLTQIATDWYMFVENMPTRRWIADDSLRTVHTATLLITDGDGISGEFVWERPANEAMASPAAASLPMGSLQSICLHEEFLAAVFNGQPDNIGSLLEPNCTWAERDYLSDADGGAILNLRGNAATSSHLAKWRDRYDPVQVSVLNRQATDWYNFAEELWVVRTDKGERRQFRKALIYAISPAGKIQSAIGYGTDLQTPTALAGLCLGQAFWPASHTSENSSLQLRTQSPGPA